MGKKKENTLTVHMAKWVWTMQVIKCREGYMWNARYYDIILSSSKTFESWDKAMEHWRALVKKHKLQWEEDR